jgi:hypothetical protein
MAAKRKSISTKTRFDVFKRDGFVCMYCGSHPPTAILHVDHIVAVAKGGRNEMDNFITACDRCNLGKGARDIAVAPMSLPEKAAMVAEKEAQLLGYYEVMEGRRLRLDREAWLIIGAFDEKADSFNRQWIQSIKKFIEALGFHEVLASMEYARARQPYYDNPRFKYFCGVCWGKIKANGGGE